MPLPLVPVVIAGASALLGALGIRSGAKGIGKMRRAKEIVEQARQHYESASRAAEAQRSKLNSDVTAYLDFRIGLLTGTCRRFVDLLDRIGQAGSVRHLEALESVGLDHESLRELRVVVIEAKTIAATGIGAATAGAATAGATATLVGIMGTASTGTAIGTLSGAAANNAILAWLGGGSIASGGGGMALGSLVLGAVVVGPTLAVTGWALSARGEKALTDAESKKAEAHKAAADLRKLTSFMKRVAVRINELREVASGLDARVAAPLAQLETLARFDIDDDDHVALFQRTAVLVTSLGQVLRAPVLTDDGELCSSTARLIQRIRRIEFGGDGESQ